MNKFLIGLLLLGMQALLSTCSASQPVLITGYVVGKAVIPAHDSLEDGKPELQQAAIMPRIVVQHRQVPRGWCIYVANPQLVRQVYVDSSSFTHYTLGQKVTILSPY